MGMPVVQIRQVRMAVRERRVPVRVRMRLRPLAAGVRMLMMRVVSVQVFVRQRFMRMRVPVPFGKREPGGCKHQRKRGAEASVQAVAGRVPVSICR